MESKKIPGLFDSDKFLIIRHVSIFLLPGGVVSHFVVGDNITKSLPVFMFMCLTFVIGNFKNSIKKTKFVQLKKLTL